MAKKPIVFNPKLKDPQGINNYPGTVFRCFTRGETLPFQFTFNDDDGNPMDITGWQCWIKMSNIQAKDSIDIADQTLMAVQIPINDATAGTFIGTVSDTDTASLPDGLVYAQAMYVNALGEQYIIDMCILEVYPSVTFTVI